MNSTQSLHRRTKQVFQVGVRLLDVCAVMKRRAVFVTRFMYWAVKHRSVESALWVLAFEGHTWK